MGTEIRKSQTNKQIIMDLFQTMERIETLLRETHYMVVRDGCYHCLQDCENAQQRFKKRNFENVYWHMDNISNTSGLSIETRDKASDVMNVLAEVIDTVNQPRTLRNGKRDTVKHKALTVAYKDRFPYRFFFDALERYAETGELPDIEATQHPECFDINECERFGGSDSGGCIVMSFFYPPKQVMDRILDMEPDVIIQKLKYNEMF